MEVAKSTTSSIQNVDKAVPEQVELFGIPVEAATFSNVLDRVDSAIAARTQLNIGVVNAAKIISMQKDPALMSAVLDSDVIYADGMSVVWASRFLGSPLPERIAGIDLMHKILALGSEKGFRVFCLGATQQVVERVVDVFTQDYEGIKIVGYQHGYFDEADEENIATRISQSQADVLFVAMTSPKKEKFMSNWGGLMKVPVVHGVGGSFDVVAGLVKRAPDRWQRYGLEWLYRVKQEPRRLWKRYLTTNLAFLLLLLRERIKH